MRFLLPRARGGLWVWVREVPTAVGEVLSARVFPGAAWSLKLSVHELALGRLDQLDAQRFDCAADGGVGYVVHRAPFDHVTSEVLGGHEGMEAGGASGEALGDYPKVAHVVEGLLGGDNHCEILDRIGDEDLVLHDLVLRLDLLLNLDLGFKV